MKKELFTLASAALIFASCANEELLDITIPKAESEGITFGIIDDAVTRGDINKDPADGKFKSYWNAEVDEISIAYYGVEKNGTGDATLWNGVSDATRGTDLEVSSKELGTAVATYKATRTGRAGYFTAKEPASLLTFKSGTDAAFRVFRTNKTSLAAADLTYASTASNVETMSLAVAAFDTQNQPSEKAPFGNFVMVADPIEDINSNELAVGESLNLSFERAFAGLVFNTKGYDVDTYGKLKSIEVTLNINNIAWNDTKGKVDIAKKVDGKWILTNGGLTKKAKLTLDSDNSGLKWSDDYYAFMQILPVDRSSSSEDYTVKFEFDNGDITLEKSSSKSWTANNFYTIELDLTAQDYVVLGNTMIVNKNMPTLDDSGNIPNSGNKAPSTITTFTSNVSLSAAQLAELKDKYTGIATLTLANPAADLGTNLENVTKGTSITELTLTKATTAPVITSLAGLTTLNGPEVTSVPAGAYKSNTTITNFNFPKVETIGESAFEGATNITTIGCNAESLIIGTTDEGGNKTSALTTIGDNAFAGVNLTLIDAPALTSLSEQPFGYKMDNAWTKVLLPSYDWSKAMIRVQLLSGTALTHIDLSGVSAIGGTGISLADKTNLVNVILQENTAIGAGAFKNAGTTGFTIENINKITSVGDEAFSGCTKLTAAIDFENTITKIGKEAFKGTAITAFDFTGITTIGEGAFQDVATLTSVVIDDVTTLEKNVFNGANTLATVNLKKVTAIKEGALTGLASGAVIMFNQVVTDIAGNAFHATLGGQEGTENDPIIINTNTSLGYNLFVSRDQTGVDGKKLTWKSGDKYYQATFESIVKVY